MFHYGIPKFWIPCNRVDIVSPPCNTFSRARFQHQICPGPKPLRTKAWPKGFPWLAKAHKKVVDEANFFVEKCLEVCIAAASSRGFFLLEHPEDLGTVQGEQPGSIWQWPEVRDLIPQFSATCFNAIHQCQFGALTPKPTRLLTNMQVDDGRCFCSLPKFDKLGFYKGRLPKSCGHNHTHKLIGKTGTKWNTSPSAAYPAAMCEFICGLILYAFASYGGGLENHSKRGFKRPIEGPTALVSKRLKSCGESLPSQSNQVVDLTDDHVESTKAGVDSHVTADGGENDADTSDLQFDVHACCNAGIQVEWDRVQRGFIDGFGLCSPTRWRPAQPGERRTTEMVALRLLSDGVDECIADVRKESFKLVTGKIDQSPCG